MIKEAREVLNVGVHLIATTTECRPNTSVHQYDLTCDDQCVNVVSYYNPDL